MTILGNLKRANPQSIKGLGIGRFLSFMYDFIHIVDPSSFSASEEA